MSQLLIQAENLNYSIPYGRPILENISLELRAGEFKALIGQNGSGKTTLTDLIMGFRKITHGKLQVLGETPIDFIHAKDKICFLSQYVNINQHIRALDFFNFHSKFYSNYSKEKEGLYLKHFHLGDLNRKIEALSSGEQRKLQIIEGLSAQPKLIIIDEITAVLDPGVRKLFYDALIECKNNGAGVLIASNLVDELKENIDQCLFISNRQLLIKDPREVSDLFLKEA